MNIGDKIALIVVIAVITAIISVLYYEPEKTHEHLLIYVAGKYSGTPEQIKQNVNTAMIFAGVILKLTCNTPFVPHSAYYYNVTLPDNSLWYKIDDVALLKSDGIFIINLSKGVNGEIKFAQKHSIPIYYSLDDIPNNCDKAWRN